MSVTIEQRLGMQGDQLVTIAEDTVDPSNLAEVERFVSWNRRFASIAALRAALRDGRILQLVRREVA